MATTELALVHDDDWVPVDRRWFGFDRRSLRPALLVLAVVIVFVGVIPTINNAISWTNETKAGQVVDMGGGIAFAPPVGWAVVNGFTTTRPTRPLSSSGSRATLANGGVIIEVQAGTFAGNASALVKQLNTNLTRNEGASFKVDGSTVSITTDDGRAGVSEVFRSADKEGQLVAYTFARGGQLKTPTGLQFTITGPDGSLARYRGALDAMLASVTVQDRP